MLFPFLLLSILMGCSAQKSPIHLRRSLPGGIQETVTLYLIDASPQPEERWAHEAEHFAERRRRQNACSDWNNEAVYRALMASRISSGKIGQTLPLFEQAMRLCRCRTVTENYRAVFALSGSYRVLEADP